MPRNDHTTMRNTGSTDKTGAELDLVHVTLKDSNGRPVTGMDRVPIRFPLKQMKQEGAPYSLTIESPGTVINLNGTMSTGDTTWRFEMEDGSGRFELEEGPG